MSELMSVLESRGNDATPMRRNQLGMSLVELMIAITLGLLLLAGLVSMFANTSTARGEIDKASRQIENGRFAMQTLSDDVRIAGYFGALATAPLPPTAVPNPCSTTTADVQAGIGIPLQGYSGTTAAAMTAVLTCLNAAAGYKPNTDVLVVRRAATGSTSAGAINGFFNIQSSGCAGDVNPYVIDIPAATTFVLHSNGSPGCIPVSAAPIAQRSALLIHIFYVSTCSNADCTAAGANSVPTLKRIDVTPTTANPTALVDGIEDMRLEYGLDATAPFDGAPDTYTTTPPDASSDTGTPAPTVAGHTWANVMAVRLHLLARNIDTTNGYADTKTYALGGANVSPGGAYKRHAYSGVVRLNNPSGRRE